MWLCAQKYDDLLQQQDQQQDQERLKLLGYLNKLSQPERDFYNIIAESRDNIVKKYQEKRQKKSKQQEKQKELILQQNKIIQIQSDTNANKIQNESNMTEIKTESGKLKDDTVKDENNKLKDDKIKDDKIKDPNDLIDTIAAIVSNNVESKPKKKKALWEKIT
jgi:hypothetical protein